MKKKKPNEGKKNSEIQIHRKEQKEMCHSTNNWVSFIFPEYSVYFSHFLELAFITFEIWRNTLSSCVLFLKWFKCVQESSTAEDGVEDWGEGQITLKWVESTIHFDPSVLAPKRFELLDAFQSVAAREWEQLWSLLYRLHLVGACSGHCQGSTHLGLSDEIQDTQLNSNLDKQRILHGAYLHQEIILYLQMRFSWTSCILADKSGDLYVTPFRFPFHHFCKCKNVLLLPYWPL